MNNLDLSTLRKIADNEAYSPILRIVALTMLANDKYGVDSQPISDSCVKMCREHLASIQEEKDNF